MENKQVLHVAVFPWLAIGHLIPFFRLSKYLAQKGHQISFISTRKNISRIPTIPSHLSSLINLVSFPLPPIDDLPNNAESSADVPYNKQQSLKRAYDLLELPLTRFLTEYSPDWIIYDYASHWLPPLAAELRISRAFFSLFTASCLAYLGPPSILIDGADSRSTAEDFTVVPKWVPQDSEIVFRLHEISKYVNASSGNESGASDMVRFAFSIDGSDVVAVRSSPEFEPECLDLLLELFRKPVIPVGFLHPIIENDESGDSNKLDCDIKKWLDKQRVNKVIYVALGTEATLSQEELCELAHGLEKSGVPFFWVLRNLPGSTRSELEMLPDGFEERVKDRGMLYAGWVSQVKILSHDSIGGFFTHCGWNSVVEGLGFGRVLVLFPVLNEQGLNARLLSEKKLGVEIERNEIDGSFTSESVAESVRLAMVDDSGQLLRVNAKEIKGVFGDRKKNVDQLDRFLHFLEVNRFSS